MILAEGTAEIAAITAHRENQTPRVETIQGLLLNGIQGKGCDLSVIICKDLPFPAGPGSTKAQLPLRDLTVSKTHLTSCHLILTIPFCFLHMPDNLKALQGVFFSFPDPAFLHGDGHLLVHGVHSLQIRKQEISIGTEERMHELKAMSCGTVEQVYFSIRVAAAALLWQKSPLPFLFDDVFSRYDDERLAAAMDLLKDCGHQVIVFSSNTREDEMVDA